MTLSITMRVSEWRSLLLKLNENSWPANYLGTAIRQSYKLFSDVHESTLVFDDGQLRKPE